MLIRRRAAVSGCLAFALLVSTAGPAAAVTAQPHERSVREVRTAALPALPVAVLVAAGGCAASVLQGTAKDEIKKKLREGQFSQAEEIAVSATVDCAFGAVPGGFFLKRFAPLRQKVKDFARPIVRRVLERHQRGG